MDVHASDFCHPQDYLGAIFSQIKTRNPRFSLRAWTRQLGLKNPGILSRRDERQPADDFGTREPPRRKAWVVAR